MIAMLSEHQGTPFVALRFGAVAGATDRLALEDCKQQTHDAVIADLGENRGGPVEWSIYDAIVALDKIAEVKELTGGDYSGLEAFLRENPKGLMVVASAHHKVVTGGR